MEAPALDCSCNLTCEKQSHQHLLRAQPMDRTKQEKMSCPLTPTPGSDVFACVTWTQCRDAEINMYLGANDTSSWRPGTHSRDVTQGIDTVGLRTSG
jgi:hypothetical protein